MQEAAVASIPSSEPDPKNLSPELIEDGRYRSKKSGLTPIIIMCIRTDKELDVSRTYFIQFLLNTTTKHSTPTHK